MRDSDLLRTPIGFIEAVLGLPRGYDWQHKAVAPFGLMSWEKPAVQVSLLAPNGSGKTSWVEAGLCLWHLYVHEKGRCTYTTRDEKQLREQFIPVMEKHKVRLGFTSKHSPYYTLETPTGGRLVAYVTNDAGRAEGFHGSKESPLLCVIAEAKSVQQMIFDAVDRCSYQGLLYSSSGGIKAGPFYKSHTEWRDQFRCVKAGYRDCPHKSDEQVRRMIQKHGENSPFIRSSIYGEFMSQDEDCYIFSHAAILSALENPPLHRAGVRVGFIDFAEGAAEYVLAVRNGNRTTINQAFRDGNKMSAVAKLIRGCQDAGLRPSQVWGDAADREALEHMAGLRWGINSQNFGARAINDEVYTSWSAEAWMETSLAVSKGELIIPSDDILISQLVSRKKTFSGRGKQGVEEKYEMRKRGIESLDRADAFCGANAVYPQILQPAKWEDDFEQSLISGIDASRFGAYAGV